jgi:two-component system sensor histidine kinase HydH
MGAGWRSTSNLAWFSCQTRQAQLRFLDDIGAHAGLVADAVGLHARGAVLAQDATDAIVTAFPASSARFVDYLDRVELFRADELTAFSAEAGLSVIRVVRGEDVVQGPPAWSSPEGADCGRPHTLLRLPAAHTLLYTVPRTGGCVQAGMDDRLIRALQTALGLPRALRGVAGLPGMVEVDLRGAPDPALARKGGVGRPTEARPGRKLDSGAGRGAARRGRRRCGRADGTHRTHRTLPFLPFEAR